jgi:5-methylcytosine-specific restriction protein A
MSSAQDILLLWRWDEEEEGYAYDNSVGVQLKRRSKGDRLFICETNNNELYLLGAIDVEHVERERGKDADGKYRATGRNISGPFRRNPLRSLKWKLRFDSPSDRLVKSSRVSSQLEAHRVLTPESAELLLKFLADSSKQHDRERVSFDKDGKLVRRMLSSRERNPKIRKAALAKYGRKCMVCGFDFAAVYGDWARDCVQVHHLHMIAASPDMGRVTMLDDVIVLCANCHCAIHAQEEPAAWKRLKRIVQGRS